MQIWIDKKQQEKTTMEYACKYCKQKLRAKNEESGKAAFCPQCGYMIRIPLRKSSSKDKGIGLILDLINLRKKYTGNFGDPVFDMEVVHGHIISDSFNVLKKRIKDIRTNGKYKDDLDIGIDLDIGKQKDLMKSFLMGKISSSRDIDESFILAYIDVLKEQIEDIELRNSFGSQ